VPSRDQHRTVKRRRWISLGSGRFAIPHPGRTQPNLDSTRSGEPIHRTRFGGTWTWSPTRSPRPPIHKPYGRNRTWTARPSRTVAPPTSQQAPYHRRRVPAVPRPHPRRKAPPLSSQTRPASGRRRRTPRRPVPLNRLMLDRMGRWVRVDSLVVPSHRLIPPPGMRSERSRARRRRTVRRGAEPRSRRAGRLPSLRVGGSRGRNPRRERREPRMLPASRWVGSRRERMPARTPGRSRSV
jgi:hypothetical protein